jgi:hypothetical protein
MKMLWVAVTGEFTPAALVAKARKYHVLPGDRDAKVVLPPAAPEIVCEVHVVWSLLA